MDNNILLKNQKITYELPQLLTTDNMPFKFVKRFFSGNGRTYCHENLEIIYIVEGKGISYMDFAPYPFHAGDIIIANSHITHQIVSEQKICYYILIIDNNFCKEHNFDASKLTFSTIINNPQLSKLFQAIIHAYSSQEKFKNTELKVSILNLLLFLLNNYSSDKVEKIHFDESQFKNIQAAIEYIKSNLAKKINAQDVAASIGISKFHFMREFKKITGQTLSSYITFLRCNYAKDLLVSGKYNIKEISLLCGFENFSYFTNVFKKQTGLLPSEFIKEMRKDTHTSQ